MNINGILYDLKSGDSWTIPGNMELKTYADILYLAVLIPIESATSSSCNMDFMPRPNLDRSIATVTKIEETASAKHT